MAADPAEQLLKAPTWARVVFVWGPLSAIALFTVYIGAKNLPDIRLEIAAERREVAALQVTLGDIKQEMQSLNATMKWICVSGAKTDEERRGCLKE